MIRVRAFQLALVGGAIVALETLCRAGIIDRFTMIPPSEMLLALAGVMGTEPWFWPDVSYTLGRVQSCPVKLVQRTRCGWLSFAPPLKMSRHMPGPRNFVVSRT